MSWWRNLFGLEEPEQLDESLKSFKNKAKNKNIQGEGFEDIQSVTGFGQTGTSSFNMFYDRHINKQLKTDKAKLNEYRKMADMPEISDVIENAAIEATAEDKEGKVLKLDFISEELSKNANVVKNLEDEFNKLFYERIDIKSIMQDYFKSYMVDGKLYLENIINKSRPSMGVLGIKRLPAETMDYDVDPATGKITMFYQFLKENAKKPSSFEEAEESNDVVCFYPAQISYVDSGIYGINKKDVLGFLHRCRQPFNQLRLLETSVVIYRLIRSPERLVFRIDTGNMPKDKAMKYVEKIKNKFTKKQVYDPETGNLSNATDVNSILENYFLAQCLRMDTKISLMNGKEKTLKDIINDFNNGINNQVYSVDQKTGKVIKGDIEWAGVTRKNAELMRVWFDNDDYVDVTPDHKFVLRDGSEVEAQYLKTNDSLMPLYKRQEKINKNTNEYEQYFDLKDNQWKFTHRMGIKPKKGYAIHHKDFDRFNNEDTNLDQMDAKSHIRLHCDTNKERESYKPMLKALNVHGVRERQKQAARKAMNKRWSDTDKREQQSQLMRQYWQDNYDVFMANISKPKSEQHKKSLSDSITNKWQEPEYRLKSSQSSRDKWTPELRDQHRDIFSCVIDDKACNLFVKSFNKLDKKVNIQKAFNHISTDNEFMSYWCDINSDKSLVKKDHLGKTSFYKILDHMGYDDYTHFKNEVKYNHKVVKIEMLLVREDTGCLTIKDAGENHNFALTAGVFVKNSSDGRGSQIDSIGGNPSGFSELDDIYYFQKKLYRSLKYPMSRVVSQQENRNSEILFSTNNPGEVARDEIKWAKFLESYQKRICDKLLTLFMVHLEFLGLSKQYELDRTQLQIKMNPPNNYLEEIEQSILQKRFDNYTSLSSNEEFSKTFLMRRYLAFDDDDLKELKKGFDDDKKIIPADEDGY